MTWIDSLVEKDLFPDPLLRLGIRRLVRERARMVEEGGAEAQQARLMEWVRTLRDSPIAIETQAANDQHYEGPPAFFELVLGRHLKYSSGYWPEGVEDLDAAEEAMLQLTCERAGLVGGQQILELGCGWGSLTLWMAEHHRDSQITAVSNSAGQKTYIDAAAKKRGLDNVKVVTADINQFSSQRRFDRVVSVEMFEHMRNYEALLAELWAWRGGQEWLVTHLLFEQPAE